jgi:hypothetical protein
MHPIGSHDNTQPNLYDCAKPPPEAYMHRNQTLEIIHVAKKKSKSTKIHTDETKPAGHPQNTGERITVKERVLIHILIIMAIPSTPNRTHPAASPT